MRAILYRVLRRRQFLYMLAFMVVLGLSCLFTYGIIGQYPWKGGYDEPTSLYSLHMLVIPAVTLITFNFSFSLLATIPIGDILAEDRQSGYMKSMVSHITLKKYLINHFLLAFLIGGCLVVIPVLVNFISLLFFIPVTPLHRFYSMFLVPSDEFMPHLYYDHPGIYLLVRSAFLFLYGGCLSLFASICAYLTHNRYLAILIPMFFVLVSDMLISVLRAAKYSLSDQFIGTENLQLTGVLFVITILLFAVMTVIYGVKKNEI
ncbi:hypothetical protein [Enterococcus sp. 1001283B150225_161107_E12]|uniref:hypothetical protein n=1 Tax=Enterococcus sp. 1001283B150225_161107_E12 TaxID=2787145 RepID=UPI00189F22A4|nr:hypothetical protein [Enterococcus sp. 1001283B150225_161107_E12]